MPQIKKQLKSVNLFFLFPYKFIFVLLFSILFSINNTFAQANYGIALNSNISNTLKHNSRFTTPINSQNSGFSVDVFIAPAQTKAWQKIHSNPNFGLTVFHSSLGNKTALGNITAATVFFEFLALRKPRFEFSQKIGFGASWISKPYNAVSNKQNTVIGSHYNNFFLVKATARYFVTKKIALQTTFMVNHASNSRLRLPNLGVNLIGAELGLCYQPNRNGLQLHKQNLETNNLILPPINKKIRFLCRADLIMHEKQLPDGPVYTSALVYLGGAKQVSQKWRLTSGLETMYNYSDYQFYKDNPKYINNEPLKINHSFSTALYFGGETELGKLGLNAQLGAYVFNGSKQAGPIPIKIGAHYYFANWNKHQRVFASVYMRSHFAIADFIALGLGVQL